jgi:hypothetical protein
MDVSALELPAGTHAAVLTGRDIVSGQMLAYPVVWADRPYGTCPRCGQPVARVVGECPVMLDTGAGLGGQILEWDKQHGCGEWLSVSWQEVHSASPGGDPGEPDTLAAAAELAAALAAEVSAERDQIRVRLRGELQEALTRLAGPLDDGETPEDRAAEVRTGSEVGPGVYLEYGGHWLAWDYDPGGSGEAVTVSAEDLDGQAADA